MESGAVDRVAVGYRTARAEYTVALAVRIAQEFPHLRQHRFLHDGHHGRHFIRVHARVERVRQPLTNQTVRVDAVTHMPFTVRPTRNYGEHFTVINTQHRSPGFRRGAVGNLLSPVVQKCRDFRRV